VSHDEEVKVWVSVSQFSRWFQQEGNALILGQQAEIDHHLTAEGYAKFLLQIEDPVFGVPGARKVRIHSIGQEVDLFLVAVELLA
jgi:hypothetical protein